jgi:hypothetical protein
MKTGCFIYSDSEKFDKLQECAIKSFKKFHPDIKIYAYTSHNTEFNHLNQVSSGYKKFLFAHEAAKQQNVNKIIILGADTITCSRLDEFLDDNKTDVLATLDYPYQLLLQSVPCEQVSKGFINSISSLALSFSKNDHVNADVVCFNNIEALHEILNCHRWMANEYYEQAALNYVCNVQNKYSSKIVDGDYENSNVVYNARAKGNTTAGSGDRPWFKYTSIFKTEGNKLHTNTHEHCSKSKQIKIWHYCDGLGNLPKENFESIINDWIQKGFNQETKDFFTNECDCGNFFKQKFTI